MWQVPISPEYLPGQIPPEFIPNPYPDSDTRDFQIMLKLTRMPNLTPAQRILFLDIRP